MSTETTPDEDMIAEAMGRLDEPPQPPAPQQAPKPQQHSEPPARPDLPCVPSPTLEALDPHRRPSPGTLCEQCPNAVWFTSPKEVKCYCRVMYITVWSNKEPNQLTGCDGIWIGQDD